MRRLFGARRGQLLFKPKAVSGSALPEISTITTSAIGLNSITQFIFPSPISNPGQPQIVVTTINSNNFNSGDSLGLDPGNGVTNWYWFNVDGAGGNPGLDPEFEVDISSLDTVPTIASNLSNVINSSAAFSSSDDGSGNVYIVALINTSTIAGPVDNATNGEFSSTVVQNGIDPSTTPNGINSGDWIKFYCPKWDGSAWTAVPFYAWFNVDAGGGDPGFTNECEVQISSMDGGPTIASVTASIIVFYFQAYFSAFQDVGNNDAMNVQNKICGNVTGPSTSNVVITAGSSQSGVNSDIQTSNSGLSNGSIILLNTPSTNYYLYFGISGFGSNPSIAGRTALLVNLSFSATATTVATQIKNIINSGAVGKMTAVSVSNLVTITNSQNGAVTDLSKQQIGAGTTVAVTQQGHN